MIFLVHTCCLIRNNSKWPLSSLFNFICLTYVYFWVSSVTSWYPKIILLKSMTFRLSNAVPNTFFGFPNAFLQCYEVWSFFWISRGNISYSGMCFDIEQNHKWCTFWSRKAMRMIDTALESLDVLFFDDKILGPTGVRHMSLLYFICGLEWNVLFNNSIEWMSFSGTVISREIFTVS